MSAYAELEARFRRLADVEGAMAVLSWDQSTQMPDGGATARGRQMATLSVIAHDMLTDSALGELIEGAGEDALDDWQAANLREMSRLRLAAKALPADLVGRTEEARAATEMAWRAAREAADFSIVAPKFETLLALVRESADCLAAARGLSPYDALLDQYDPGLTFDVVEPLFDDLAAALPLLVDEILAAQSEAPDAVMPEPPFDRAAQEAFGREIMGRLGFDFERGRLDVSHHPFTGGVPDDSRITTRYNDGDFTHSLMGIIHETGHALYEQGLPAKWRGQPVGGSRGMTIHESQSLIMEMQLGRSDAFIGWIAPKLAETYGGKGPAWSTENLVRIYRRVERGFIRVDADEATYPLHVILRTRLERALLAGDLATADLPGAWNEAMRGSLGITPPSDREGCLQDIHWYMGAFGYFPTYTLGALTAAQMNAHLRETRPNIETAVGVGDFSLLLGWLRENVHEKASRLGTTEIIEAATGRALGTSPFKTHIGARYLGRTA